MANVLITGSSGYIAEYVIRELKLHGHKVIGIDNGKKGHKPVYADSYNKVVQIDGDCRDTVLLTKCVEHFHVDVIIGCAALIGGIAAFHRDEYEIISQNTQLVDAMLRVGIRQNVEQVIYLSSSMVYECATSFPSIEGDESKIPPPLTSYGFQKLEGERHVQAASKQYGLNYTVIRPFNAIGNGEKAENEVGISHVVPDLIKKTQESQDGKLKILGDGSQVRCFTHCKDIARAIVLCVLNPQAYNQDFNIVNNEPVNMLSVAEFIWKSLRTEPFQPVFVQGFEHDVRYRVGSNVKAKIILGWEPQYTVFQGLKEMIDEGK